MSPDEAVRDAEQRIINVLTDFDCSYWLRGAARAAIARDPVDAIHDAELLLQLLQPWAAAIVDAALASAAEPPLPFAVDPVEP